MRLARITRSNGISVLPVSLDDAARLTESLLESDCVHVVANDGLEALIHAGVRVRDHGWKKEPSGLAHYLVKPQRAVHAVRTRYNSLNRFLKQGVATLLAVAKNRDCPGAFLVGVPDALFAEVVARAEGKPDADTPECADDDADPKTALLNALPDIRPPQNVDLAARFRGESVDAQIVRRQIPIVAQLDDPVLILGDTGTGKGIVARAVHDCSPRGGIGPFVVVNCGAVPMDLFESELFGYAPGAFTGALRNGQTGLWEKANGGTLFLDEIADLPIQCQPKILHALQDGVIMRVNEGKERNVDARIIAATCQNLFQRVEMGLFREDLYYRLRRFLIRTPGLRNSADLLPGLICQFWHDVTKGTRSELSPTVVDLLARRSWTGNHRELKGFLRVLHGTWREGRIRENHVRALLIHQGPSPVANHDAPSNSLAVEVRRLECLQHLNRTAEVLHALQNTIEPLTKPQPLPHDLATALDYRLFELDRLVASPLRFGKDTAYAATAEVRDALARLKTLLPGEEPRARTLCRRETRPLIKKALEVLFGAA